MDNNEIMDSMTYTIIIASIFAIVGLIAAVIFMRGGDKKYSTQLLGSILVVSISFSAHNTVVYTISVFVIATLVTELQFLEKIAALIWNRKEYWDYLSGNASKEEIKAKVKAEVEAEIEKDGLAGVDDVEPVEEIDQEPTGITDIEDKEIPRDKNKLVLNALQFERSVIDSMGSGNIPFPVNQFRKEVRITSGAKKYIIDGIVETDDVHYVIEIKNITRPSSLVNAVRQIETYKSTYENYLRERKIRAAVQPIIIIPDDVNISGAFRGIPIAKYNAASNSFSNLNSSYPDYELSMVGVASDDSLRNVLLDFLKQYSRWAFSPLRIQKWGSKQAGFEKLDLYTTNEIRQTLVTLLNDGLLDERTSKKGNKLYRIKL